MIELSEVRKSLELPVLRGVSLKIPEGGVYGLVGPAASGKTLLLKLMSGLLRPDAGSIVIDGISLSSLSEVRLVQFRQRIGMQFQSNALFDFMRVQDNIAFPLERLGQPPSAVRERVEQCLRSVGLWNQRKQFPAELSGGQKRRTGLARAMALGAKITLYDEPAAGLDPVTSQRIFNLLSREHRHHRTTALIVSSDLPRLFRVVDRVIVLMDGEIVFEGPEGQARACADPRVSEFVQSAGVEEV